MQCVVKLSFVGSCGRGICGGVRSGLRASRFNAFGTGTVCELKRLHSIDGRVKEFVGHGMVWPISFLRDINVLTVPPDSFLKEREVEFGAEPCLIAVADEEFFIWPYCAFWFHCDNDLVL